MKLNTFLSAKLFLFFMLFLFTGCITEHIDVLDEGVVRRYTVMNGDISTKTHFDQGLNLLWDKGDVISIFDGTTLNQKFGFDGETDDNSGTFSKLENKYGTGNDLRANYAVYPYDSNTKISENENGEGVIRMDFPSVQNYGVNSFGLESSVMVAATNGTNDLVIKFKNACGWIKFLMYGDNITVKSVTLQGKNGEKISGASLITMSYGNLPQVEITKDGLETITLDCGKDGITISNNPESPTEFWFSVPPVVFKQGFNITITDVNGYTMEKGTAREYEVTRNYMRWLTAFKVEVSADAILQAERNALVALYEATDGDSWIKRNNWCTAEPVSEWHGVTTDQDGFVTRIDLPNNGLTGEIPSEIGNFSRLQYLDLNAAESDKKLGGTIPESICKLTSLEYLYLQDNNLAGAVPKDLGNLRNMKILQLQNNLLSAAVPESIWTGMDCLELIDLSNNKFRSLNMASADKLSSMKNTLECINLNNNPFNEAFPVAITEFSTLKYLCLNGCGFEGNIPSKIGNLTNLLMLELGGNNLTGEIPSTIFENLTELTYLSFGSNDITGEIPQELGNLIKLQTLCLDCNPKLTGSVDVIFDNCEQLVRLNLQHCNFIGTIPGTIEDLTELKELNLCGNGLTGSIPPQICSLRKLEILELHDNILTGSIPENIGHLTGLNILNLGGNKLSGSIPASITSLSNVKYVALGNMGGEGDDKLTGEIPQDLYNLESLEYLFLDLNDLSGNLPDLRNMNALKGIWLNGNSNLGGKIARSTYDRLGTCEFKGTKIKLVEDNEYSYSGSLENPGEGGSGSME